MLNSGKKFRALRDKKINILTLVLFEKKILNETKKHTPPSPFKLNGRFLKLMRNYQNLQSIVTYAAISVYTFVTKLYHLCMI